MGKTKGIGIPIFQREYAGITGICKCKILPGEKMAYIFLGSAWSLC